MTTPADEIRAAAAKLRELAADATDGPWAAHDPNKRWGDDRDHQLIGGGKALATFDNDYNGPLNTAYAATMHPGVGKALADWLDHTAAHLTASTHPDWQDVVAPDALNVARAINREHP
jgi:hypothetical protein